MNRVLRLLRHRALDERDTRRAISPAVVERLQQRVAASERRHSGEIRVCVEAGLPLSYLWRGLSARERALTLFGKLRVWDTAHNNGVLIYLLLADRDVEIVADRGVHARVGQEMWQHVCEAMEAAFREGRYEDGALAGVDAVSALLAKAFPRSTGSGELPDRPVLI